MFYMKNHNNTLSITEGTIWKQLLLFFFPILFGTFFQQLYNTADAMIVGQFVGKQALSAVGGSASTIINLLVGFFVGLSSGATVIVAQYYGAKNEAGLHKAVHTAIALSIVGGLIIMILGILFSPGVMRLMGNPEEIMSYSVSYIRIYFSGMVANLIYNIGSGILRAIGDSKRPLYFLIVSCLVNILLDLLFVIVFHMEVVGVALATVISQIVSAVLVVITLLKTNDSYRLAIKDIRFSGDVLIRIFRIGLPAGLQSVMYSFSNIIIQAFVNSFGTDTIAAWTTYGKIDCIFWMIISALGISMTTFIGQNYGARKLDRVHKGVRVGITMAFVISALVSVFLAFTGKYIYRLFTDDAQVLAIGSEILQFMVPAFFTYVCIEILAATLRGIGDALMPMLITCVGVCVFRIVWLYSAMPIWPSLKTVMASYPLTWVTTSVLFIIYYNFFSPLSIKKRNV